MNIFTIVCRHGLLGRKVLVLHLFIPIIDKQETASVKPEPAETGHDRSESVKFMNQPWYVFGQESASIEEETLEHVDELVFLDFPSSILVLRDKRLLDTVPYLI